ncbi:hypothetical protein [Cupriavidus malaysiensis]|uniref:DNA-binding protein n=1 Tax=Cupriavidus malaysiensis TaxID=367825 RepID=A0ABN4TLP9_9BURK|nr:hypothetical protein [Cupriavidus malaysiensis]AOZ05948.1 hypothetical protein BKK80_09000 [Cupriavidus malaysiensis]
MNDKAFVIERESLLTATLRDACRDAAKRRALCEATGWDDTMPNKVANGAGVTLEKIHAMLDSLGLVVTTRAYMDYLARGNEIGSSCLCARMSMGACGRHLQGPV